MSIFLMRVVVMSVCVSLVKSLTRTSHAPLCAQNVNRVSSIMQMGAFHAAVEVYGREWAFGMVEVCSR